MNQETLFKVFLAAGVLIVLYFSGVVVSTEYQHQKDMELMTVDYEKQIETIEKVNECEKLKEILSDGQG